MSLRHPVLGKTSPTPSPISDQAAGEPPCGQRDYCGRFPFCGCGAPDPVFRERDMSKPAEQQGLFHKFDVRRVNGSDQEGGKHYGCRHFVLDMDHDVHAVSALLAYADSCAESHPQLAAVLRQEFRRSTAPTTGSAPEYPVAGTPAASWRIKGEPDPHGTQYDCERAALTLGKLTDDELANGVFMNADQPMDIERMLARDPEYHAPIVWLTAAKERIRWLSRALLAASMGGDKSTSNSKEPS